MTMRQASLAALAAASLALPLGAQVAAGEPQPQDETPNWPHLEPLLEAWRADHGEAWQMRRDRQTGHVGFLHGGLVEPGLTPRSDAQYFELAEDFVTRAESLIGVTTDVMTRDRVLLLPLAVIGSSDKISVRHTQQVNGVPVTHGYVSALLDTSGRLLAIENSGLPNLSGFDTTPTRTPQEAQEAALLAFQADTGLPSTSVSAGTLAITQEVDGKERVPALTWDFEVRDVRPGFAEEGYLYSISANGPLRTVTRLNLVHEFDVGGNVTVNTTPPTAADSASNPPAPAPAAHMTVTWPGGSTTTDVNGDFNIPGGSGPLDVTFTFQGPFNDVITQDGGANYTETVSLSGTGNSVLLNPSPSEFTTAQANCFTSINEFRDWTRAVNPGDSMMDFVNTSHPNISLACNATFSGSRTNYYQVGSGCNNTAFSSVIAHEQGHWQNVRYGNGNGPDGYGEGAADVWAMYLYDDPIVGRDFTTSGGIVRTGENTRAYCGDGNNGCHGGVHANGEVLMGAMWKTRRNLKTTHGVSAGGAIADALWHGYNNAFVQGSIDSVIIQLLMTIDDDDGNILNGSPNFDDINDGFAEQGFPPFVLPFIQFDNVVGLDPVSLDDIGPYGVAADLTALQAAGIATASFHYRVDGGAFTEVVMTNTGGSRWIALVPGIPSPARVDYFFSGEDTGGGTQTSPQDAGSGDYLSAKIGSQVEFFFSDFEQADDDGWTHEQIATQDDWQRGTPNGANGTSSGVAWADPPSAFSGANIWGNDLAPSGFNGAYQPNVENRLISPDIDLSGASGVSLGFKRWLTVEEGVFDQAQIRVNGTTVWENPANGNLIDTAWTDFEVDISAEADGVANTDIEFRLITDGGLQLGGWNIDDLSLFRFEATPTACLPISYGVATNGGGGPPALDSAGQPAGATNSDYVVKIRNGPAGATAFILGGSLPLAFPIFGGTLNVFPELSVELVLDEFGQFELPVNFSDPGLVGTSYYLQVWILDPGAPQGISMTQGLELSFCN